MKKFMSSLLFFALAAANLAAFTEETPEGAATNAAGRFEQLGNMRKAIAGVPEGGLPTALPSKTSPAISEGFRSSLRPKTEGLTLDFGEGGQSLVNNVEKKPLEKTDEESGSFLRAYYKPTLRLWNSQVPVLNKVGGVIVGAIETVYLPVAFFLAWGAGTHG